MKLSLLPLFCLATAALSQDLAKTKPKAPNLSLLFSANLTLAEPIDIGTTPFGQQLIVSIKDGKFWGPKFEGVFSSLKSFVLPHPPPTWAPKTLANTETPLSPQIGKVTLGLVSSLVGSGETQRADATYVLTTNDGANIVVTERAVIPYVEVLFETGSPKYAYLNKVIAWATGSEENGLLQLNFWQVCVCSFLSALLPSGFAFWTFCYFSISSTACGLLTTTAQRSRRLRR